MAKKKGDFDSFEEWDDYNMRLYDDPNFALQEEKISYEQAVEELRSYMARRIEDLLLNPARFNSDLKDFVNRLDERLESVRTQLDRVMKENNAEWYRYSG